MKRLLAGLLIIAAVGSAQAATRKRTVAPRTIQQIDKDIAVVDARIRDLEKSLDIAPVEEKVVEIRIYKKAPPLLDGSAKRKRGRLLAAPVGHGTCSGALISADGNILTAKHCVDEPADYEIMMYDNRSYTGIVVASSTAHDLALIHIDRRNTPHFELASAVAQGQKIFTLGSPLAIGGVLATGVIAKLDGDETLLDCSVLPGNSGGPVLDEQGKLVGIVTSVSIVMLGVTHLSQAQGVDAVYFFLKEVAEKRNGCR